MYYVITPMQGHTDAAEIKPKEDTADFLQATGLLPLRFSRFVKNDELWQQQIMGMLTAVTANDIAILQLPTYAGEDVEKYIVNCLHKQGARVVVMLHDIDYLRFPDSHPRANAIEFLNRVEAVLVSTTQARTRLVKDGVAVPISIIGPWGYEQPAGYIRPNFSHRVHYAGNITARRSGFLSIIPTTMDVEAYGSNDGKAQFDFEVTANVHLRGVYSQFKLGSTINDGFGLVWDGDTRGNAPDYAHYNMPHKLSLYLAQGIPVIAQRGSASGDWVAKNKVGIVADNLAEAAEQVNTVSEATYSSWVSRIARYAFLVRSGRTVQRAALTGLFDAAGMVIDDQRIRG